MNLPLPWLMIIDMQRVFGEADSPWFTPGFDDVMAAVMRLRPAFGSRVVVTRFVPDASPSGAWDDYYRCWPFALEPETLSRFDLVADCPVRDAVLIDRPTFSKWGREAGRILGAAPLVMAGVSTECCVLSTALAAADAGVRVRIAADACAGLTAASHRQALDIMGYYAPHIEISNVERILHDANFSQP